MNTQKNSIDPRHIVRDVTEDLFREGLLGYAKWLSVPENREWAQGVVEQALGASEVSTQSPHFEDWAPSYEDWKQGGEARERVAMIQKTVPEPFVGLRWKESKGKDRVISKIQGDKAYVEKDDSPGAYIFDLWEIAPEIARDIHHFYRERESNETTKPTPVPAPMGDYSWAKSDLQKSKIHKELEKTLRHEGRIMTKKEFVDSLLSKGATPEIIFEPTHLTRSAYNRMDNREQAAWERRQVEQGLKPTYLLSNTDGKSVYTLNKTEFDYAYHTSGKPQVKVGYYSSYLSDGSFRQAKDTTQQKYPQWFIQESAEPGYQPPTVRSKGGVTVTFRRYTEYPGTGTFVIAGGSHPAVRGKSLDWHVALEKAPDLRDAERLAAKLLPFSRLHRETGNQSPPMGAYRDVIDAVASLIVTISVNGLPEISNV